MERNLFYITMFNNIELFLFCMMLTTLILYLSSRRLSISGFLDPIMFYWIFTFGTAYGIVLALYLIGSIKLFYVLIVFGYGILFICAFRFFNRIGIKATKRYMKSIGKEGRSQTIVLTVLLLSFLLVCLYLIVFVGIGALAQENRFEQNRGSGAFVRIFVLLRLFWAAYLGVMFARIANSNNQKNLKYLLVLVIWFIFAVVSALIDGAKFAFLETVFASALGITLYKQSERRINYRTVMRNFIVVLVSLIFAVIVYGINLQNNGKGDKQATYVPGPYVVEATVFRVIANADKYFLGLSDEVMTHVEVKPAWVRIAGSMISSTAMSKLVGYNVNDYSVGKQIFFYWVPDWKIAGGPTSHFDLYAYKQFGIIGGAFFTLFIGLVMSRIYLLGKICQNNVYLSCIVGVLWLRAWAILIEPPLGLGYIFDVLLVFTIVYLARVLLLRLEYDK